MIHGRNHRFDGFAIRKSENRNLSADQKFLDDNAFSALTEFFVLHHISDGILRLLPGHSDGDALAERKSVGFDNGWNGRGRQIGKRGFGIVKHSIRGSGNVIFLHQIFCKNFAAFNDCRICPRTEAGNAGMFQGIDATEDKRIIRRDHGIINFFLTGEGDDFFDFTGTDGNAYCI